MAKRLRKGERARGKKSIFFSHDLHYFSKLSMFGRVESFNSWSLDFPWLSWETATEIAWRRRLRRTSLTFHIVGDGSGSTVKAIWQLLWNEWGEIECTRAIKEDARWHFSPSFNTWALAALWGGLARAKVPCNSLQLSLGKTKVPPRVIPYAADTCCTKAGICSSE